MANNRRRLTGTVVSNKMDKTVVVEVARTERHKLYGKVVKMNKRFMAHDADNACEMGDTVVIVESRPMSKNKRWSVQEILRADYSARTTEVSELSGVDQDVDEIEEASETEEA